MVVVVLPACSYIGRLCSVVNVHVTIFTVHAGIYSGCRPEPCYRVEPPLKTKLNQTLGQVLSICVHLLSHTQMQIVSQPCLSAETRLHAHTSELHKYADSHRNLEKPEDDTAQVGVPGSLPPATHSPALPELPCACLPCALCRHFCVLPFRLPIVWYACPPATFLHA